MRNAANLPQFAKNTVSDQRLRPDHEKGPRGCAGLFASRPPILHKVGWPTDRGAAPSRSARDAVASFEITVTLLMRCRWRGGDIPHLAYVSPMECVMHTKDKDL